MASPSQMLIQQQMSVSPEMQVREKQNSLQSIAASPTGKNSNNRRKTNKGMSPFSQNLFKSEKWICTTFKGKLPERRSNMAYFVDPYTHRLYVFGGHDLKEGMYNSLWRISLEDVQNNMNNAKWEQFEAKGNPPCPNSHLCGFIYQHKLFLFGGAMQEYDDPREVDEMSVYPPQPKVIENQRTRQLEYFYPEQKKPLMFNVLNLQTFMWSDWRKKDFPSYDDFANHFITKSGHLYIFGGFKDGFKCNELFYIDLSNKTHTIISQNCKDSENDGLMPCQRSGTRMVCDENTMLLYIFGGLANDNHTLNDMWIFDIEKKEWLKIDQRGQVPKPRAGHSMNLYKGKIFMFGGLIEVTQESSELFVFDIETHTWTLLKSQELEEQQQKSFDNRLNVPMRDSFNETKSTEREHKSSFSNQEDHNSSFRIRRRNIRSAAPGKKKVSSINVGAINADVQSYNETMTTTGPRMQINSINSGYTTSCRAIVMNQRPAFNPKPGPIPAPLSLIECKARRKSLKQSLQTTLASSAREKSSTARVTDLLDRTSRGRGTVATLPSVRGRQIQHISATNFQFKRHESPTDNRMKNAYVIQAHNKSFELYYQEMRRRRLGLNSSSHNQNVSVHTRPQSNSRMGTRSRQNSESPEKTLESQGSKRRLMMSRNQPSEAIRTQQQSSQARYKATILDETITQQTVSQKNSQAKFLHSYPTARDGHAAIVYFGCLWIFGGDRHHMPFNDLRILPLAPFVEREKECRGDTQMTE